ncbi:Sulfate permease family [Acididesulfobacillus acetoxydans]|uniref:Sulfate permease family n=1 Tax=Acididesulfobacillus acetoxydans TaxID=1561005 RepID=A0A8S0Y1M5_9FIRM|nr:SulP family inorganic anion transporter [Acididesulfobacillus acetoxydans]CAA7599655.1 Sulfate permease family [Acididesulfobacillus acetoxydans]CEJ06207.1 Sulfate transporter 4.1, chloroplastic [Acididesulfobacillus acetoxydans]
MSGLALSKYIPLLATLKGYKKEYFGKDLVAALTVAVVGVPQSMAYALIAGVNPVYGLYTSIVGSILGSAFGSSQQLVTGPTNAICLLVAGAMRNYLGLTNAYQLLFLMTFLVGAIQIVCGVVKLGKAVNFVSHTVIVGFTAGAGVLIALGQINTFLGISIKNSAQMATMDKLYYVATHLPSTNIYALGLGLMTVAILLICKRVNKNLPGALIGIIVPIFFVVMFSLQRQGVSLVGHIASSLPPFTMVRFSPGAVSHVFSGAVAIAIIGLVEAISISKAIASNTRQKIDASQEFIGQGIANLVASFFQCLPSSGSFTRSAINYSNGAVSKVSGMLSGVTVALVLLFFAPYAKFIPNPCLAGVIILTGYSLIDKKEVKKIAKAGRWSSDAIAMWVTFAATVLMPNLDYAIYSGIALSFILYLKDTDKASVKVFIPMQGREGDIPLREVKTAKERVEVLLVELSGNLYFVSASDLEEKLDGLVDRAKGFILRMNEVNDIDATSLNALEVFARNVAAAGGTVVMSGLKPPVESQLKRSTLVAAGQIKVAAGETDVPGPLTRAKQEGEKTAVSVAILR